MQPILTAVIGGLLLSASLAGQVTPHVRALPKAQTGASYPAQFYVRQGGQKTEVLQLWFRGDNLPRQLTIRALAYRYDDRHASAALSWTSSLVLDNSSLGFGNLSRDLAANLGSGATQVFSGTVKSPAFPAQLDPDEVRVPLTFTRPFVVTGPHLLVQETVTNLTGSGSLFYDGLDMPSSPVEFLYAGKSCGGTLTGQGSFVLGLTGARPGGACAFLIGTENVALGSLGLPIDLGPIGLSGCELGVIPELVLIMLADASGIATLRVPGPPPSSSVVVSTQVLHQTMQHPSGWATTGVVNAILGDRGYCNSVVRYGDSVYGPFLFNRTVTLLIP